MRHKLEQLASLEEAEALYPLRRLPQGAEALRTAPSPTGFPHIGTAMQAVLNRALALKTGGVFLLRIEDTDRARLVPGAEEAINATLEWLGVAPDEGPVAGGPYGPYRQSERLSLYRLAAERLLATGHAYHCFCSPQRLEELRKRQSEAGENPRYDRRCLALDPEQARARLEAGERSVIRLKAPENEAVSFRDEVRGEIRFEAGVSDDPVLIKGDGFPTYHLASVVDDHFMRISLIIRGEEWISSTPKHIFLYRALGWEMPRMLHTVILRDAQRRKLSKRSGDTSMRWFRLQGYLPEGFRNFLTRLLCAHPQEKDIYPFEEFASFLSPELLPRTGPVVNPELLDFINGHYLRQLGPEGTRAAFAAYLRLLEQEAGPTGAGRPEAAGEGAALPPGVSPELCRCLQEELEADKAYAAGAFALEPERNRRLSDIFQNNGFFFHSAFIPASRELMLKQCPQADKAQRLLRACLEANLALAEGKPTRGSLTPVQAWDEALRLAAQELELKPKAAFMLSRLAVTGLEKTPPLHEILTLLGPERSRARLEAALALLAT